MGKKENEVLVKENEAAKDILVENEKELEQLRSEREALSKENYIAKDAFLQNSTELSSLKKMLDRSQEDFKDLEEKFKLLKGKHKMAEVELEVAKNQVKISKMSKIYQKVRLSKRRKVDLINSKDKDKSKSQKKIQETEE